ncbi:MAG: 2-amino-3,7-dideoxy-D-threo-hept-6-ulosonate synthase [Lentisphaerota bacterium]
MSFLGKQIRLERIMSRNTGKTVIIPLDHGVTVGPIKGLINMAETVDKVAMGGANAVIEHMGMVGRGHRHYGKDIGLILHLSASSEVNPTDANDKVQVNTVERALKMGADGVSVHINIGSKTESAQLELLGRVAGACLEWGMPLLAMMYPRGEGIEGDPKQAKYVKLAARIGAELGADIVKTYYTGDPETMREVTEGCPVPVVIAGGSKLSDKETLEMVFGAMQSGCAGLSMGRNAFQHEDPAKLVAAACAIVHQGAGVREAMQMLRV